MCVLYAVVQNNKRESLIQEISSLENNISLDVCFLSKQCHKVKAVLK